MRPCVEGEALSTIASKNSTSAHLCKLRSRALGTYAKYKNKTRIEGLVRAVAAAGRGERSETGPAGAGLVSYKTTSQDNFFDVVLMSK